MFTCMNKYKPLQSIVFIALYAYYLTIAQTKGNIHTKLKMCSSPEDLLERNCNNILEWYQRQRSTVLYPSTVALTHLESILYNF